MRGEGRREGRGKELVTEGVLIVGSDAPCLLFPLLRLGSASGGVLFSPWVLLPAPSLDSDAG